MERTKGKFYKKMHEWVEKGELGGGSFLSGVREGTGREGDVHLPAAPCRRLRLRRSPMFDNLRSY